jgi:hypothetical protein
MTDEGYAVLEAAARGHVEAVRRHLFDVLTRCQVQQLGDISAILRDTLRAQTATQCEEEDAAV